MVALSLAEVLLVSEAEANPVDCKKVKVVLVVMVVLVVSVLEAVLEAVLARIPIGEEEEEPH